MASRLPPNGGQLLVVGTRVAPVDLYRELRNPEHYTDAKIPWTYLAMPAVLGYGDDPSDWETLWPKCDLPLLRVTNRMRMVTLRVERPTVERGPQ